MSRATSSGIAPGGDQSFVPMYPAPAADGMPLSGLDDQVDRSQWPILYPNYLNSKKTIAQGRRIPKALAAEDPDVREMKLICDHLEIPAAIELKCYPRDWLVVGRLRVLLVDERTSMPFKANISNKRRLLVEMGRLIPDLKTRSEVPKPSTAQATSTASTATKKKKKKKK
eukprot:GHVT01073975.1.p1 GENE.GHVT01073975.1~~GHVT01073975.1.p1  ORF type:complete len:170 (-),score=26.51 GHVT01073975.1:721-1230(-)